MSLTRMCILNRRHCDENDGDMPQNPHDEILQLKYEVVHEVNLVLGASEAAFEDRALYSALDILYITRPRLVPGGVGALNGVNMRL